ncbi:hypothetical protein [Sulfitobacter sp. M22]|uniref:hypothetical protein n=1 Tax=Sulfitobacter sp. M22 TaxID=2675332 RepID=UPI001F38E4F9|nr:hypothetical protein [Sulfitobacter sp. M22]MCF7725763.1 hypothetical protein [Sulfitobacter sp. M22]
MEEATETKRDRVRRLLIDPLKADGFRFARGVTADDAKTRLDRLADDLAYLKDDGLVALRISLRTKGEGTARCFWPAPATVLGLAESFQRRPLDELPQLLRWFASAAGGAALLGDRLVAEYWFWTMHKRPPVKPMDKKIVAQKAEDWRRRVELAQDRIARGHSIPDDDAQWLEWYKGKVDYVEGLVGNQSGVTEDAA